MFTGNLEILELKLRKQQAIMHYTRYLLRAGLIVWLRIILEHILELVQNQKMMWRWNSKIADGYVIICFENFTRIYNFYAISSPLEIPCALEILELCVVWESLKLKLDS